MFLPWRQGMNKVPALLGRARNGRGVGEIKLTNTVIDFCLLQNFYFQNSGKLIVKIKYSKHDF
jgi:hypothetical protein